MKKAPKKKAGKSKSLSASSRKTLIVEDVPENTKTSKSVLSLLNSAKGVLGESITLLGITSRNTKIEGISFGVPSINFICTGNPFIGVPYGRIAEAYSEPSNGKTTLFLNAVAQEQAKNEICVYIDMEHAIDPGYAKKLGVILPNLIFSQPDTGEEALEIIREVSKQGARNVIIDSIASMVPKVMADAKFEKNSMALQARMLSEGFKVLTPVLSKNKTALLCVNQVRKKVGLVFGDPTSTPGGEALKFAASIRMQLRLAQGQSKAVTSNQVGQLLSTKETQRVGSIANVKIVKNKCAPPFQDTEIPFMYGLGYDIAYDYFKLGAHLGFCEMSPKGFTVPKHGFVKNGSVYENLDVILKLYKNQYGLLCDEKVVLRGLIK